MQIILKYITTIIRHLLGIKVFHNHMLFTAYFDKRNKSLKHYAARKIFNIDFLKLKRSPPGLSQILHWCRWLLFTSIKMFWSNKWLKSDVSFFFIEIFKFISLVCNACMGKLIVTSPFVILLVWWIKKSISYMQTNITHNSLPLLYQKGM